jgi:hypothetical protein
MKIKDRNLRKELMEQAKNAKMSTGKLIDLMRTSFTNKNLSNETVARLNDIIYRPVKTGNKKRLDERAIKNDAQFQQNEAKLKALKFDAAKLTEANKVLVEEIGCCPMSLNNAAELVAAGDCMCLTLDIARSEACVNDPTKLVVKQIFPSYMSLDSFLDSAIYKLECNRDAAGGFDYKN